MKNHSGFAKLLNRLGVWTVPLITVGTFLPIVFVYLAYSEPQSTTERESNVLPSLSQIPAPTPSPAIAEKPTPSGLQRPQPIQPSSKASTPLRKSEPQATSSPVRNPVKATPKSPVRNASTRTPVVVPPDYTAPRLDIKVAIVKDASSSLIGTSVPATISDSNGRVLQTLSPSQGVWVTPNGTSLTMGDWHLPQMIFVQPGKDGLVYVDDRWYRGKILIVSQGTSLLVVNYVDLEAYLYSVVGSEMHPTAPREALKAQAIAARSYALVHIIRPASAWYNLGNTQRWQVYKGIQTEYTSTQSAVSETAGQILSYKGGVVESLYAATDEIVSRAHGGKGMSQTGAYELAGQGYDHQEILGYYYPGVGLARLILQQ